MDTYRIVTEADTRSKSRRTRTWTIEASDIEDAWYQARMKHLEVLRWNGSIWVASSEVVTGP